MLRIAPLTRRTPFPILIPDGGTGGGGRLPIRLPLVGAILHCILPCYLYVNRLLTRPPMLPLCNCIANGEKTAVQGMECIALSWAEGIWRNALPTQIKVGTTHTLHCFKSKLCAKCIATKSRLAQVARRSRKHNICTYTVLHKD